MALSSRVESSPASSRHYLFERGGTSMWTAVTWDWSNNAYGPTLKIVRNPHTAATPNISTKARLTRCCVVLPLLQAWSTATSHIKKRTIANTARLFSSMDSLLHSSEFFEIVTLRFACCSDTDHQHFSKTYIAPLSGDLRCDALYPEQCRTGNRGYLGNVASLAES
jgi:hypothetical protein